MPWNWEHPDWPDFAWDNAALAPAEAQFQRQSGIVVGALKHVTDSEKDDLIIDLISTEAVKTSEIEGEILNRQSVQASIKRNFGLDTSNRKATPAEQGIAEMMTSLYRTFDEPLSHSGLFEWHRMLTSGCTDLTDIGRYRTHDEPMQIVSGADYAARIHFEAPPSRQVKAEMGRFVDWFNGSQALPPITRAGIAHLYFESIHPFEDGNGRIGRAIAEKALSQSLGQPTLLALSQAIQADRKAYYQNLERYNKGPEITGWLEYFAATILKAQDYSLSLIEFLIAKTRLYDRLRGQLNARQEKAIARLFREGPDGFKGGLSAENYIAITGTSRATATRDLADLVDKGALIRTGERRYARYWLGTAKPAIDPRRPA
ncbi:MAG: Fic family protein [Hoeflea sp.]|uniref:Fic family protein n=1 Tax=Hoeflea sp. TaxID=1940281 RepID=UPI001DA41594|nr:Fic family protein [Hoeflea sp.]MBU4527921.1 Fic family protein [Alphaproteobacteria bacterium]MBU4546044.1 Fic family protein [Alphaproteobacteria bacterium]MBU4553271.1 Fic family protein [Alphaproteobacteria bacterium]MBV1724345.1 Fic family protein [Hoeflea sp.]MBV1763341.1 Fic family protein [Hoeflea sp.]